MKKALVVGGTGFLGRALCGHLHLRGWRVASLSRSLPPEYDRQNGVEYFQADIGTISTEMAKLTLKDCSVVYNLANATVPALSNNDITGEIHSTVESNIALMTLCLKHEVGRYIYASSGGTVYGKAQSLPISERHQTNPLVTYGINKLFSEKYAELFRHNFGLDYRVLRIANPFGPGQSPFHGQGIVARYLYSALSGEEFRVFGDGTAIRDYIYVDDVSRAFESVAEYSGFERVFNVGRGVGVSINEIVAMMDELLGINPQIRYSEIRSTDIDQNYLDISLIKQECDWRPRYEMAPSLAKTIDWLNRRFFSG